MPTQAVQDLIQPAAVAPAKSSLLSGLHAIEAGLETEAIAETGALAGNRLLDHMGIRVYQELLVQSIERISGGRRSARDVTVFLAR